MKNIFFSFLFFTIVPLSLFAQEGYEHLSPYAHGAGRTYVVSSRGLSSVGLNPALLGIDNEKTVEIQIFPISTYGLDAGPSFSDASSLSHVFNSKSFNDSDLSTITDLISNNKLSGRGDAEILGVSYRNPDLGAFAFTWTTHAGLRTEIPQSFIDFAHNAPYELLQSSSSIQDFDLQGIWYNEYSISYGKLLEVGKDTTSFFKNISVGGSLKYVSGIAYIKVESGNYIRTTAGNERVAFAINFDEFSSYSSNFDPQHVPNRFSFDFITNNSAGSGIGADIGICGGFFANKRGNPTVLFGLSITDIGSITWTQNATERIADHINDTVLFQAFAGQKIQDVTDSLAKLSGTVKHLSSFVTPLPSMFRTGILIDLDAMGIEWGAFGPRIAIEYANGLNSLVGSLKNGRLGAGLMLERQGNVGLRLNGGFVLEKNATDITLGFGITLFKFFDIDIASAHIMQFFKSTDSRSDLALGIRAAF
jgi:hypothetical protein